MFLFEPKIKTKLFLIVLYPNIAFNPNGIATLLIENEFDQVSNIQLCIHPNENHIQYATQKIMEKCNDVVIT